MCGKGALLKKAADETPHRKTPHRSNGSRGRRSGCCLKGGTTPYKGHARVTASQAWRGVGERGEGMAQLLHRTTIGSGFRC